MATSSRSRKLGSASLFAGALLLVSAPATAQTPPPAEPGTPEPSSQPAPPEPPPAPPAAPEAPPAVRYPMVMPTHEIKLNADVAIRLGLQVQLWADSSQDSLVQSDGAKGGYQNNFFVRRGRLLAGVMPLPNITLFMLLEGSNVGRATGIEATPKSFTVGLVDAWAEIKINDALLLEGGLMLVPLTRNILQGTTTYLTLDVGNTSAVMIAALQTAVLRDLGFQVKGTILGDHLEYRLGVYSGIRNPPLTDPTAVGAQNAPRFAGYLQYNFWDVDKGYVFNGTYYGRKRILGVSSGFDFQKGPEKDPYYAMSAAAFAAIPINGPNPKTGADEIGALLQYIHYDGNETAPSIASQNDLLAEVAYFNRDANVSVFGKFEAQLFSAEAAKVNNRLWFGGGVKYHLMDNYCNFTLAYNRSQFPEAATTGAGARNSTNQFTFAFQVFYY